MFPSSRNISRFSDPQEKVASSTEATPADEPESARSRFFSDRQLNRRSVNNDKEAGKDSWTMVKDRREGQKEREDRFGRHDREDGERRNGFAERHDPRWGNNRDDRRNGDRPGGWRDREQQRRERDGDRGHTEKEPEWMDDPVMKKDHELNMTMPEPKTQEEFEKWKQSMSKKVKGEADKGEPLAEATPTEATALATEPKAAVATLKLDAFDSGMFGGWNNAASASSQAAVTPGAAAAGKPNTKPKASRFASMFKPAPEEPVTVEETPIQQVANGAAKTSAEDQEGFNRVLQMLTSTKLAQALTEAPTQTSQEQTPVSPPPSMKATGLNGANRKPKSRFTDMFAQKSPERLQSPPQGGAGPGGDSMFGSEGRAMAEESQQLFGARKSERQVSEQQIPRSIAQESTILPESNGIPFNALREQQPRPASGRMNDMMFDPPSRGAASPDVNIQNLLAQQRQRPYHTSTESQQLLNLLKKDSRPPSQHAMPSSGGYNQQAELQRWLDQQNHPSVPTEPYAPKPRVLQQSPGLVEEQLMRGFSSEQQRQDQVSMQGLSDMPQRRPSQRAPPPGFYEEQTLFLQQQQQQQLRRQFNDPPPQQQMPGPGRRTGGHPNLPQMQIPHQQSQQFPQDFHHITSPNTQGPPPPGFNPHMQRHPPGFNNMNIFQQQQQGQQQREGPPPGFGGNLQSPPANAPPGFFGTPQGMPPGFIQMRSPIEGMPPQGVRQNVPRGYDAYDPMGQRR